MSVTEDAAREALPDSAGVTASITDGTIAVTISGLSHADAQEHLAPFTFAWQTT